MYKKYNDFYKFNNRLDFLAFVEDCQHCFGNVEEWEDFFGFGMKYDEDTGEPLETFKDFVDRNGHIVEEPDSYPAIAFCIIENERDRFGTNRIRVFTYVTDVDFEEADEAETNPNSSIFNECYSNYVNRFDVEELPKEFKESIYTFIHDCIKEHKDYSYIYTALHKQIDRYLYEYEIDTNFEDVK